MKQANFNAMNKYEVDPDFTAYDWGNEKMDLTYLGPAQELRPTELHLKKNGSLKGEPSFLIVMGIPGINNLHLAGQISLEMLNKALTPLGYMITEFEE